MPSRAISPTRVDLAPHFHYRVPTIATRAWGPRVTTSAEVDRFIPLKPAHFHILLSLSQKPAHGYGVRQEVEERTGGTIVLAAGTLYETLQRLQRDGLVEETDVPPEEAERASSRWRFYEATRLGKMVLKTELTRLEADVAAARAVLPVGS
jgi:DNA-binding PadR family transcriptional regulator